MEKNVFLIKWYGPFKNLDTIKDWEIEQPFKCSLYLIQGKRKYAKTRDRYYCGMSSERKVFERLRDNNHHIGEIKRLGSIYVGFLANIKRPNKSQIKLAEKLLTACLTDLVGVDNVLNITNTLFPSENVFVINEWWKTSGESIWERRPKNAPSNIIPDVLTYRINDNNEIDLYGCKKLKRI